MIYRLKVALEIYDSTSEATVSKRPYLLAAAFLAVTACTTEAPDTSKAGDTAQVADASADEATIRAEAPVWFDLYNKSDAAGVTNLYAEDGIVLAPGAPAASGRDAIRTFMTNDIAGARAAGITLNLAEITGVGVSGDLAWLSGTFTVKDRGGATVDTGKYLSLYRRTSEGWKLIRDTWNSDKASPAPAT